MGKGKLLKLEARNETFFLDGIKVLLVLMVLTTHFYNYVGGRHVWGVRLIGALGPRAVDVFFFLSGFLTIYTYIKKSSIEKQRFYLLKRFFRIYPVYFFAIILAYFSEPICSLSQKGTLLRYTGNNIAAYGAVINGKSLAGSNDLFQHLLLIQGMFTDGYRTTLLGPAWSMPVEWFYYIVMALVFVIVYKTKRSKPVIGKPLFYVAYALSLIMGLALFVRTGEDNMQTFIRNLPLFFIGMIVAMFYHRVVSYCEFLISFGVGLLYLLLLSPSQNFISAGIIMIAVGLMFLPSNGLAGMIGRATTFLSKKLFCMGCKISYSVYLLHMLIMPIAFEFSAMIAKLLGFSRVMETIIAAILFVGLCVAVASLVYMWVEKPFIKIGNKAVNSITCFCKLYHV